MTEFKTALVPLSESEGVDASLDAAFGLAATFGTHVLGLHVRSDPTTAVPLVGEGMSGGMVEEMMTMAERQAAERADKVRAAFDAACTRHAIPRADSPVEGPSAAWLDITGREEEAIAWRGRLADLVIMGRPADGLDPAALLNLNAALMESGKPLLLTPPTPPAALGRRVAIAWNGSAEAGRAVAAALPLLRRAEAVTILTATESGAQSAPLAPPPASELASYLSWHGIAATTQVVPAGANAGVVLLEQCAGLGADLLVMGAYTHSRLRQLILGGVTRHVLGHAPIPLFLCH